ncbi:MAG: hypothetical protein N2662_01065 [Bacteroidales bacterium]|nr:hypothetical protein [Bacteroidales bacterium]
MRTCLLPIIFLFLKMDILFSQTKFEKETFEDAEFFFASESYRDALPLYLQLQKRAYKDNANILYHIGICYLNIPGEKSKSIEYLEKAAQNASTFYKKSSLKEKSAPLDVWIYLGNAYRINMQLTKAIEAYEHFLKINKKSSDFEINWILGQIDACKRAELAVKNPVSVTITPLGRPFGTKNNELNPVFTHDEKYAIYAVQQKFYNAIYWVQRRNGGWGAPVLLNTSILSDGNLFPVFLSDDGNVLLLNYVDLDKSDIYISKWTGKRFSNAVPFKEINSKYWESHACISSDGKTLYFTSNRPSSIGGLDIFFVELLPDSQWTVPRNIGTVINTTFNEETPFLSVGGDTLYFSSQGHSTIGGFDVFFSVKQPDGVWSEPVNLGYPVNTTDDDLFYLPVKSYTGYQSRYMPEFKNMRIVKITYNNKVP